MPLNIDDLRNDSKSARFVFGASGDLNITFYPHRINVDLIERYQAATDDKDYDLAARIFGEVVTDWDLMRGDGERVPINGESMRTVGSKVFNEIWDRLTTEISPKSQRKNGRS